MRRCCIRRLCGTDVLRHIIVTGGAEDQTADAEITAWRGVSGVAADAGEDKLGIACRELYVPEIEECESAVAEAVNRIRHCLSAERDAELSEVAADEHFEFDIVGSGFSELKRDREGRPLFRILF